MNTWLPKASNPLETFLAPPAQNSKRQKNHESFMGCICTGNGHWESFCPCDPREVPVPTELPQVRLWQPSHPRLLCPCSVPALLPPGTFQAPGAREQREAPTSLRSLGKWKKNQNEEGVEERLHPSFLHIPWTASFCSGLLFIQAWGYLEEDPFLRAALQRQWQDALPLLPLYLPFLTSIKVPLNLLHLQFTTTIFQNFFSLQNIHIHGIYSYIYP